MMNDDRYQRPSRSTPADSPPRPDLRALDDPALLAFVFHPRRETRPSVEDATFREPHFPVGEGVVIASRFFPAGLQEPTLLFFHGNGEIASDYDEIAPLYTNRGINVLVLDYRGYGRSTGSPTLSAMLQDARTTFPAAQDWLSSNGYRGQLWAMGRSLGSAPAIEIARHYSDHLKGLILESGFADTMGLLRRVGIPEQRMPESGDWAQFNLLAVQEVTIPMLIIHGEWDQIIPLSDGEALLRASGSARKELVVIPRAGHNDLLWMGMERYMDAITSFIRGGKPGD